MDIELHSHDYSIREETRAYAEAKLSKLGRFLEEPATVRLTLTGEPLGIAADLHVSHRHGVLQARESHSDVRSAILAAIEKAQRQLQRDRERAHDRWRRAGRDGESGWPAAAAETEEEE